MQKPTAFLFPDCDFGLISVWKNIIAAYFKYLSLLIRFLTSYFSRRLFDNIQLMSLLIKSEYVRFIINLTQSQENIAVGCLIASGDLMFSVLLEIQLFLNCL